jgi:hypothetical protein
MKTFYEITYIVACDDDGLVSHTFKSMKEILPQDIEEDDEEDNSTNE